MHGRTSGLSLPAAYRVSNAAWDGYMAGIWHRLFDALNLARDGTVVDIAPGGSTKIVQALAKHGFRGRLVLLDAAPDSCARAAHSAQTYLPEATIEAHPSFLADSSLTLPREPDLIAANHPLDDMLVAEDASSETFARLFAWTQSDAVLSAAATHDVWTALEADPERLTHAYAAVRQAWIDVIGATAPRAVIISQYASSALTDQGLDALNKQAKALLNEIKNAFAPSRRPDSEVQALLDTHENYDNRYIGDEVLAAAHWGVLTNVRACIGSRTCS
jgi:hypothetical protein